MANFYYVKEGGTATGDAGRVATTKSTGSFATKGASAYYDDVDNAYGATTPPATGDFILVSNASSNGYGAGNTTLSIPDGVNVISVDDSNCDQYAAGATIENSAAGNDDALILGVPADSWNVWKGFVFDINEAIKLSANNANHLTLEDCEINKIQVSGSTWSSSSSGAHRGGRVDLLNCSVQNAHDSNNFQASMNMIIDNLVPGATYSKPSELLNVTQSLGGQFQTVKNCNIVELVTTTGDIFMISSTDNCVLTAERCVIGASQNIYDTIPHADCFVYAHSCDVGDGYNYQLYADYWGQTETDTTTYADATYDGTNGFSIQVDTTAEATVARPFRFKISEFAAQDMSTSQTISVEAYSATASLTDSDWWLELVHNDNTDEALGIRQSGRDATAIEVGDGTGHSAGSATWSTGSDTKYVETITPGALSNVDNGNIEVWIVVAKPSLTINFDMPTIAAT